MITRKNREYLEEMNINEQKKKFNTYKKKKRKKKKDTNTNANCLTSLDKWDPPN